GLLFDILLFFLLIFVAIASDYATKYDMNCITLDGDQVNRKGAFSGGYHDERHSKLKSYQAILETEESLAALREEEDTINARIKEIDNKLNKVLHELNKCE